MDQQLYEQISDLLDTTRVERDILDELVQAGIAFSTTVADVLRRHTAQMKKTEVVLRRLTETVTTELNNKKASA